MYSLEKLDLVVQLEPHDAHIFFFQLISRDLSV
jgi:hypothetical protein